MNSLWSLLDMLKNYPLELVHFIQTLETASLESLRLSDTLKDGKVTKDTPYCKSVIETFDAFRPFFEELGVVHAFSGADVHLNLLRDGVELDASAFMAVVFTMRATIESELKSKRFFLVQNADLYRDNGLFGNDVDTQFPQASFEISEAGKCMALERYTAAVFHLMRAIELALRAFYASLGLPPFTRLSDRNWSNILRQVAAEIEKRDKTNPRLAQWRQNREFVQETYARLAAVKDIWRDSTMHVEATYPEESTRLIMDAVRNFFSQLASRIDESGAPTL